MTRRITMALTIAGLYLAVTSNLQPSNLVAAALVGLALAWLLPPGRALRPGEVPIAALAGVKHALFLIWDVLLNGVVVARMVLGGRSAICPGFVKSTDRHDRELASALEAHAITISPGTMVVDFEGRRCVDAEFEIHCLDTRKTETDDDAAPRARRVARLAGAQNLLQREPGDPDGPCVDADATPVHTKGADDA